MIRCWVWLVLCVVALSPASACEDSPTAAAPAFPLIGWWGPPPTEADYRTYRAAHLNTVLIPADPPRAAAIHLARTVGLHVLLVAPQQTWEDPDAWRRYADNFDNVLGWVIGERVTPDEAPNMAEHIRAARRADPIRLPLVTLAPLEGGHEWDTALAQLLHAGMPALCYHCFALHEDGLTDENTFYADLAFGRRIAVRKGVPLWGMILVTKHGPYRRASESDIRFQVYSYLAAGARALCYYTYWGPSPQDGEPVNQTAAWGKPMVDPVTHRPLYGWEVVEQVNKEVLRVAPVLTELKPVSMYFVGDTPKSGTPLPYGKTLITSINAEKALIGFMGDREGRTWAMLVNRRHGKNKSAAGQTSMMQVFPDPRVSRVTEVDRSTGRETEIPVEDGSFLITIPGGTGSLLRLDTHPAS